MVAKKRMTKRKSVKRGGAVRMPLEYFGSDSGRYFAAGDAKLADGSSAYGPFVSVSQGVPIMDGQMVGPNMGPYPSSSCTQTGGRRRSIKRNSSKHKSKKHHRKHKSKKHHRKH
jgi:hypothetical protein